MVRIAPALAFGFLLQACGVVEQPASLPFVAAVEIDMRSPADRADLLAMLRRHAAAGGLHVDDVSEAAVRGDATLPPSLRKTIYVGVWRGTEDDDLEVSVDDMGHLGRPWVAFSRGARPDLATPLREALLRDIGRRWPGARRVPVLPSGGLPLPDDLRPAPGGYRIARSAARNYGLQARSPLVDPR